MYEPLKFIAGLQDKYCMSIAVAIPSEILKDNNFKYQLKKI